MGRVDTCFDAPRFRCSRCRLTATVLPDDILPGMRHDLATLGGIIAAYLDGAVGYRELPLRVLGLAPPPGLAVSTMWGDAEAPSPTPSTCFRWLARFAAGARAWWLVAARALQQRGDFVPPPAPGHLDRKARSDIKQFALRDAWQAVSALYVLAERLGTGPARWPFVMQHVPTPPPGLDHTGWFCKPPPPP